MWNTLCRNSAKCDTHSHPTLQLWFRWQIPPPPHSPHPICQTGGTFSLVEPWNFLQIGSGGRKAPSTCPPRPNKGKQGKIFISGSMHFTKFPATLVQVAEKPPPIPVVRLHCEFFYSEKFEILHYTVSFNYNRYSHINTIVPVFIINAIKPYSFPMSMPFHRTDVSAVVWVWGRQDIDVGEHCESYEQENTVDLKKKHYWHLRLIYLNEIVWKFC